MSASFVHGTDYGPRCLILKSDLANAIFLGVAKDKAPCNKYFIEGIPALFPLMQVVFKHVVRWANKQADLLDKQGVDRANSFVGI